MWALRNQNTGEFFQLLRKLPYPLGEGTGNSVRDGSQVGGDLMNVVVWKWRMLTMEEREEVLLAKQRLNEWVWQRRRQKGLVA